MFSAIRVFSLLTIFFAGLVAALNLATLYPNPAYDAALWKVFLAVGIAIGFGVFLFTAEGEHE